MVDLTEKQIKKLDEMGLDPAFVDVKTYTIVHEEMTCKTCNLRLDAWTANGCGGCNENCPHVIETCY